MHPRGRSGGIRSAGRGRGTPTRAILHPSGLLARKRSIPRARCGRDRLRNRVRCAALRRGVRESGRFRTSRGFARPASTSDTSHPSPAVPSKASAVPNSGSAAPRPGPAMPGSGSPALNPGGSVRFHHRTTQEGHLCPRLVRKCANRSRDVGCRRIGRTDTGVHFGRTIQPLRRQARRQVRRQVRLVCSRGLLDRLARQSALLTSEVFEHIRATAR